jgi:hypothetical protein
MKTCICQKDFNLRLKIEINAIKLHLKIKNTAKFHKISGNFISDEFKFYR